MNRLMRAHVAQSLMRATQPLFSEPEGRVYVQGVWRWQLLGIGRFSGRHTLQASFTLSSSQLRVDCGLCSGIRRYFFLYRFLHCVTCINLKWPNLFCSLSQAYLPNSIVEESALTVS